MIVTILHAVGTVLDLAALATVTGISWCLISMIPVKAFPEIYANRVRQLSFVSLLLLAISSIDSLVQRSLEISGFGISSLPRLLPTVLFKTHYGHLWILRLSGLFAAWLIVIVGRRRPDTRITGLLLFISAAVIAFSRSATGHPADFGDLSTQQMADWLHLLSISCWAGALFSIAYVFPPFLAASHQGDVPFIAGLADRFYRLFGPAFAILVITGLYNAWFTVGSYQALVTTRYGRLLLVKLTVLVLLALRYIAPPERGADEAGFVTKFLLRTRVDAILAFCILVIVSQLVHIIPARHELHLAHASEPAIKEKEGHQPVVLLETDPPKVIAGSPVRMTVRIRDRDGMPLKGLSPSHERILHAIIISRDLDFFAHIHAEDIAPVTAGMLKDAALPLQFTFPRAGEYLIGFDFAADDASFSKTVSVTVADAPVMGQPKIDFATTKSFGDYQVSLKLPPEGVRAETDTTLRFVVEKNGEAVTDLEPYLGASMHLAIVPVDLKAFIHAHGEIPGEHHAHHDHLHSAPPQRFGPEIDAEVVMPAKGVYKIFSQVRHQGKVLLFDFMVDVQ